tara:strand:+ start:11257 stop:12183 length:927 start_codon:yes stop_codon:yes gene_type:complete
MNDIQNNFFSIIESKNELNNAFNFIIKYNYNILLYCNNGFPLDFFIDEIIKKKFNISTIFKTENIWGKNITYYENRFFFEINLINPNFSKNYELLTSFIGYLIKIKNIHNGKHLIIIKHIDLLKEQFSILKILLEKYSSNVFFICTTFKISTIEDAIKSRFTFFRIPLFKTCEIDEIFKNILNKKLNNFLLKSNCRNLIFSLFISEIEDKEPHLITEDFCNLKFPPIYNFIKKYNKKKNNLDDIRKMSYNCFQYNITIQDILHDYIYTVKKIDIDIIQKAADIEHKLNLTNKGREPIYIESFLCYILL